MQLGLVQIQSNQEIDDAQRKAAQERDQSRMREQFESRLAAHIRKHWHRNKRAKEDIHDRMLSALRQRNGEYDPNVLAKILSLIHI